jgi:hypothetical protein
MHLHPFLRHHLAGDPSLLVARHAEGSGLLGFGFSEFADGVGAIVSEIC